MSQTYLTGTVSVSGGNAIVSGTGTAWVLSLVRGGLFCCGAFSIPILSVESDAELTLALPWPGASGSGQAYAIFRETAQSASAVEANDRLAEISRQLGSIEF